MSIPHVTDGETDLDSALFNPIIDRVNGLADGEVPIPLAGIEGALGGYEPLQNMRRGVTNVLDVLAAGGTIQDAIDEGGTTYFPYKGEPYDTNEPLVLPDTYDLRGEQGTVVRASDEMPAVLWRGDNAPVTSTQCRIAGLNIDANQLADAGVRIDRDNYADFTDLQIKNFLDVGLDIGVTGFQSYELSGRRIRIIGPFASGGVLQYPLPDYGMRIGSASTDSAFSQIFSKNSRETFHVAGSGNWLAQCHGYGWEEPEAACDYGFRVAGSSNSFTQCYADGPQVAGFLFEGASNSAVACTSGWVNENPPVDAVAFKATAAGFVFASCYAFAVASLTLQATNIDYDISTWTGSIVAPNSRLTHVGGSHLGRSLLPSGVQSQGSVVTRVDTTATTRSVAATDHTLLVDASGGSVTINLPSAGQLTGRELVIKRTDNSGNSVVVDGNASETIDGATTKTIVSGYGSLTIVSNWNGTGYWSIVASQGTIT